MSVSETAPKKLSEISVLVFVRSQTSFTFRLIEKTGNTTWLTNITGALTNSGKRLTMNYGVKGLPSPQPNINYVSISKGVSTGGSGEGHFSMKTASFNFSNDVRAFIEYYSPIGMVQELTIPSNFIVTLKSYSAASNDVVPTS